MMRPELLKNNIPSGWLVKTLADLGEFKTGGVDKKIKQDEKPVKLVNYMDAYKRRFIDNSIKFMEVTASDSEIKIAQVKVGDMLFTPSSETPDDIGHSAVVAEDLPNTLFSYHLTRLRFNEEYDNKIDLNFRAYFCNSRDVLKQFEKMSVGATRYTISKGKFESIQVLIPESKTEQKKIAEILGTVDEDIAKTQEVIEATEKLKRGLMQQLFTRGIGHTKFKETKIGQIPEGWRVASLQTMLDKGLITSHLDGNHGELYPKSSEFINEGVPYLSANCIEDGHVNFAKAKFLSPDRASKFLKGVAINGDILFAHNATVGPVAILNMEEKYVILSTTLTYYRCNSSKLVPSYLRYFMESPLFSNQYGRVMAQTTRNQVPITIQRTFFHALPAYKEQEEIAEILSAVDEKISVNKKLKEKLTLFKKGLMQDLLSGKVRVKV